MTGTETDLGGITNPITAILPEYTNIAAAGDEIPHSKTDNLYNPNGGFAPGVLPAGYKAGNFSFGGLAFHVGGTPAFLTKSTITNPRSLTKSGF